LINDNDVRREATSNVSHRTAKIFGALTISLLVAALAGCQHSGAPTKADAPPHPTADSLIVSVDDVRQISGVAGLQPDPKGDAHQPERNSSTAPGPCQAVDVQQVAFGDTWQQFRAVSYNMFTQPFPHAAKGIAVVNQSIGSYPDTTAARDAFDKLVPQLNACSALHAKHMTFTVTRPDPSTAILTYAGNFHASIIYHAQSQYLVLVEAMDVPNPDHTAHDILRKITTRID
jgi:hypothetical protein